MPSPRHQLYAAMINSVHLYYTLVLVNLSSSFRVSIGGAGSVVCLWPNVATVYRPRQPRASPLYRTIERHLPEFERCYDKRFANRYGRWRPIISDAARRFLRCGDLHFGFARVRCPDCAHEMFVPFSCRLRCLCPSCHQKRTLLSSQTIAQTICAPVPGLAENWRADSISHDASRRECICIG